MSQPSDDAYRQIAAMIERDNPLWMILWGVYSREYWAFAKFDLPRRVILHDKDPNQLAYHLRQVEARYLPPAALEPRQEDSHEPDEPSAP